MATFWFGLATFLFSFGHKQVCDKHPTEAAGEIAFLARNQQRSRLPRVPAIVEMDGVLCTVKVGLERPLTGWKTVPQRLLETDASARLC
ncbi:hypothetical protein JQK88_32295 [Mesorhizobium caraganae]|uniref:hypothetical protein n=1 Tax=Mesorhizobium caraganae TaxID=483206 RepID=UPI00193A5A27|nr:hypothetical protein [Mesorhizobium caraganae]MBM2715793.1 hypothetical protein [Mesorhizobium caraganae]